MNTSRFLCPSAVLLLFFLSFTSLLAQRPIAYYPLDGNANDAGGNGYHGLVQGAVPTTDRFGNPAGALAFTAAEQDHIAIRSYPALSFGTHDFTVVAWVKFCGEQDEYAGIVCKGPSNNSYPGYQLHIASGDKFTTQIGDEGNWTDERRGTASLGDGQWHLVAVAVSPAGNTVRQYVDGRLVTQFTQVYTQHGPLNVSRFDPTLLLIGVERNLDRFFDGSIDDVRLFDRALSAREIWALFSENGWTGNRGPVAYYPFNGNADDASGNGLNGLVHGAVPTLDRFGNCNSAYAFNGSEGDYISVPHNRLLAFEKHDFTVVAWVKFCGEQDEYAGIVCKGPPNNSYPGYQLHIASGDKFTTQIGDERNWTDERRGKEPLNDGKWHMVAVTVSPASNAITQYVDGEPVAAWTQTYTQRGPLNVSRFDPTSLLIGVERNLSRFFTGLIDDVRLYDKVLSRCEMNALYSENGWTGETTLPEPGITVTGPTTIRPGESARLSVGCYPYVQWSTGQTGKDIVVNDPGVYTALVSDGSGCPAKTLTVTINGVPSRDSFLLTLVPPERCVGSAALVYVPIRNALSEPMVITEIAPLRGGEFVESYGGLPAMIQPGEEVLFVFNYRWFMIGRQETVLRFGTLAGQSYLVNIESKGNPAYTPVLDRSQITIEDRFEPAEIWVNVTNTSGMNVTFTDASWSVVDENFELVAPTLPLQMRPGESARLHIRYTGGQAFAQTFLVLGGEGVDRYGEYSRCIAHHFDVQVGIRHDQVAGGSDSVPVTGSVGSVSGVGEEIAALRTEGALEVHPNPAQSEAHVTFVMVRPGDIVLDLFNAEGVKVRTSSRDQVGSGTQSLRFDVDGLPSGLYMLRLTSGNIVRTAPVVVRR